MTHKRVRVFAFVIVLFLVVCGIDYAEPISVTEPFRGVIARGLHLMEGSFIEYDDRVYISMDTVNEVFDERIFMDGNVYRIAGSMDKGQTESKEASDMPGISKPVFVGEMYPDGHYMKGQLFYGDGRQYNGEFKDDVPHGLGELLHLNGDVYVGLFKNGYPHGTGTMIYRDGSRYTGEIRNGVVTGYGSKRFPNNDVYKGYFYMGLYHGAGVYSEFKGPMRQGLWEYGEYKRYMTNKAIDNYVFTK